MKVVRYEKLQNQLLAQAHRTMINDMTSYYALEDYAHINYT